MSFDVEIGHFSLAGSRPRNEDFAACLAPDGDDAARGLVAAIADGVSSGGLGLEAAQTTAMSVVQDYFGAPDTWHTTAVLDRVIGAQNSWLVDHNRRRRHIRHEAMGMTTLTALVLRGHGFTLAHVGDTRAHLLRGDELVQLTQDHVFDHPDQRARLTRAIGLDDRVRVDYLQAELQAGDLFVLTSDGVHGELPPRRLAALAREGTAQQAAEALVRAALAAGGRDNATAMVLRVRGLADGDLQDALRRGRDLPVPPRLKVGDRLDGFTITARIADNGVHCLYQARSGAPDAPLVALKTLHLSRANDPQERAMLAHEAWLASRVAATRADGFVRLHELREPSAFYVAYDWHAGRTLEQRLAAGQPGSVGEALDGAIAITRALARLHRLGVVHRDVKPANLHRGDDGQWRLLDLGVAVSGREPRVLRSLHAGTPSYMNPEQWASDDNAAGEAANAGSDLFALGVTLYQWLTGRLPYGEVQPHQRGRYRRDPKPPSRLRPEVPIWLDHVVLKAVALDPRQRFETAEELLLALERGASRQLAAPPATPLVRRDPLLLARLALGVSLLVNLLLVVWLLFLPR